MVGLHGVADTLGGAPGGECLPGWRRAYQKPRRPQQSGQQGQPVGIRTSKTGMALSGHIRLLPLSSPLTFGCYLFRLPLSGLFL